MRNLNPIPLSLVAATLLAGCESSVTVDLSDGPTDGAQEVVLDITHVALLKQGGAIVRKSVDGGGPVDLLAFRNGNTLRLLGDEPIDPGDYVGVALDIDPDGAFVTLDDGTQADINVPAARTFADVDFTIPEFGNEDLVIDLDLRFSLVDAGDGSYDLEPKVRAVQPADAGTVTGLVNTTIVEGTACAQGRPFGTGVAVYAYKGSGLTPNDYVGQASLVAADDVEFDAGSGQYEFELHFLPAGSYTLALTCEADEDDPATDDAVVFTSSQNVTVPASGTVTLNFL